MRELILTFFYSGKVKKAPGTFASLLALILWFLCAKLFFLQNISLLTQDIFWIILLTAGFVYGSYNIKDYAKKFGQIDHSSITLDEAVGQILALQFTFSLNSNGYFSHNFLIAKHLILSFIFFRFFDIKKPLIIGWCDKNLKNGFGVMFDDLLCGIITSLLVTILL